MLNYDTLKFCMHACSVLLHNALHDQHADRHVARRAVESVVPQQQVRQLCRLAPIVWQRPAQEIVAEVEQRQRWQGRQA